MSKKICIVDGNALMHRAFHAINQPLTAQDGTPTNAVFGFFNMFCKYVTELSPDVTLCTFDHGKATHRLELYEKYKANRPHMDDKLRVQFPVVERVLKAMDVPIIVEEGWEGDDCMGTISKMCRDKGYTCYLVTGDKDMNQLVGDDVFTVTSDFKNRNIIIRDTQAVHEKFGVDPGQIIDYLALVGDSSDNIPGVPGIGEKSAAEMLGKYGSLDGVYENLCDFKGKKLENLTNHKDDAYLSQTLATINVNLDIDIDLENVKSFDYDDEDLSSVMMEYGLRSSHALVTKMRSTLEGGGDTSFAEELKFPDEVSNDEALSSIQQSIEAGESIAFSFVEPTKAHLKANPNATTTFGISDGKVAACFYENEAAELVALVLEKTELVGYDAKKIINLAFPQDSSLSPLISDKDLFNANVCDVHVAANMANSSHTFKTQEEYFSHFGKTYTVEDDVDVRAREFAYLMFAAKNRELEDIEKQGEEALALFNNVERKLTCVLSIIERNGCPLNDEVLAEASKFCTAEMEDLTAKIYEEAGHEFNIDSPVQLSIVLFQEMGIPPAKKKKLKTGAYSTDAKALEGLKDKYEICANILRYRELAKLRSTYVDALDGYKLGDGLVHTQFNQAATATGRLSSSDPNLQNIPVRTELGKSIRKAFIPLDEKSFFMSADYSQIELRLLAHLSGDEHMIESFKSGRDLHAQTAARIFGVDYGDVTHEMRARAKTVNFGIVYGQQAWSLSKQLKISFDEAQELINRYYESFPGVKSYLDNVVKDSTVSGYATTIYGRRRVIPEIRSANKMTREFGERTAKNHPMQGSAADIIKIAMNTLERELLERKLGAKILIQVHDELDLSVPASELDEVGALVKETMENVIALKVPLIVDVNAGQNWAEAH